VVDSAELLRGDAFGKSVQHMGLRPADALGDQSGGMTVSAVLAEQGGRVPEAGHGLTGSARSAAYMTRPSVGAPVAALAASSAARARAGASAIAFQERFVIVHYRGPALLGADHLDQVTQEADAPGAVKGGEHVRFQRMRDAGSQIAVLGQHACRQDEHLLEVRCPRLDL
jgi:hypothetical protein